MVDPNILTAKAVFGAFIAVQIASHIWVRCDGVLDRMLFSVVVTAVCIFAAAILLVLHWFFFVWS